MTERTLVIGLGNEMRGDDAAGLRVADLLAGRDIEVERCEGEPIDLLERWRGRSAVIVVDAVEGERPGRVWRLPLEGDRLPLELSRGDSTHLLGLAEVLALGRQLDLLPERLELIGIEGSRFALGGALSVAVEGAVVDVAAALAAELDPGGGEVRLATASEGA